MIECPTPRSPEDGVEELIARTCRINGDEVNCSDSCPGDTNGLYQQDDCKCGTMVYKQGRTLSEEELYELGYGVCSLSSSATPLARLTALVKLNNLVLLHATHGLMIDLSRLEQQIFLQNSDLLPEIQKPVPLHNAGKNYFISLKL